MPDTKSRYGTKLYPEGITGLRELLGGSQSTQRPPPGGGFAFGQKMATNSESIDRPRILKGLRDKLLAAPPTTPGTETGFEPSVDPAIESKMAELERLPTRDLAKLLTGSAKVSTEKSESDKLTRQSEAEAFRKSGEDVARKGMYEALGLKPPAEPTQATTGIPKISEPEDTGVREADARGKMLGEEDENTQRINEMAKALESIQPGSGPEAEKIDQADRMDRQKDFADLQNLIRTSNEGYRADIQKLHDEIEKDRPDLFSLGSIFFMLSNGPQKWLQRHDQQLETYRERRNRALGLAAQGKSHEADQMIHAGLTDYSMKQRERYAEKYGGQHTRRPSESERRSFGNVKDFMKFVYSKYGVNEKTATLDTPVKIEQVDSTGKPIDPQWKPLRVVLRMEADSMKVPQSFLTEFPE